MKFLSVIEIPKGCDRRIHKSNHGEGFVDLGLIKDLIPINEGRMPVCYGFLKGIPNESEGDEVDVLVFSKELYKTGDEVEVEILGLIEREDGDHKVVAKDGTVSFSGLEAIDESEWALIIEYFGHKHKIISVGDKEKAVDYLLRCGSK